jgi:sporulation protein YunB
MRKNRGKIALILICLLLITGGTVTLTEFRIKSIRDQLATLTANNIASSAVTKGIDEALQEYKINYDDIVNFTYDSGGNIKSISTDIITLNNLGNRIGEKIDSQINQIGVHELKIPMSALLGEELTSGIGPRLSVYFTISSITMTKFENKFESAGVNQTRHQIFLNVTVNSYVINGSKVDVIPYTSNVCIAESIVVGITPQTFADFSK